MTGHGTAGDAPPPVRELADRRSAARNARDFAVADELRDRIRALGWLVTDSPAGPQLMPAPGLDADQASDRIATVGLLIEGWPDDLRQCVAALLEHLPPGVIISGLDVGNADGAGDVLHALALANPGRVTEMHMAESPGWGAARNALLRADPGPVHVVMETSTVLTGDAISPLLTALTAEGVVAAGWRGADPDSDLHSFHDAGPGPVTALLGYLMAVSNVAAARAGGFWSGARFYRNADLEFSLRLGREGTLLVPPGWLPVRQTRHRGYHDSDHDVRDAESRRNYRRVLELLRTSPDRVRPAD
ncbi:MAG: hypothetical protein ACLQFR_05190 [Streptosporangiaceae bacterium]